VPLPTAHNSTKKQSSHEPENPVIHRQRIKRKKYRGKNREARRSTEGYRQSAVGEEEKKTEKEKQNFINGRQS